MPHDEPLTLDTYLEQARAHLDRVAPSDVLSELRNGAVLVDIRDSARRETEGRFPDAIEIEHTVLEWRLAPTSDTRLDIDPDAKVIIMCNEGFSSSLAAARLQKLGLPNATDLDGGFQAWSEYQAERFTASSDDFRIVTDPPA